MTADYAALEARVAELERQMQEVRHDLPARLDALGYGVGLLHQDLREFRAETRAALDDQRAQLVSVNERLNRHGELLTSHSEQLAAIGDTLAGHGELLGEILRRLPADG